MASDLLYDPPIPNDLLRFERGTDPSLIKPLEELVDASPTNHHNWVEDWPHENGQYMSKCHSCGQNFIGHKRRTQCKVCATAKPKLPTLPEMALWVEEASDIWAKRFRCMDRDIYTAQFILEKLMEWQKKQ